MATTYTPIPFTVLNQDLLATIAKQNVGKKVTVETVLDYVFKYGTQAVSILSTLGVFKNKNLIALQEIAQRGYNQNDVAALAGQLDLSALQKEVDDRNAKDAKDNTLLYVGLAFVALVAIYLITKQSDQRQYDPIEYKQYRKR